MQQILASYVLFSMIKVNIYYSNKQELFISVTKQTVNRFFNFLQFIPVRIMNYFHRFNAFPSLAILFMSQCFGALFPLNVIVLVLRLGLGTCGSLHCVILIVLVLA